jgi:ABC-type nickel/cobalt efflux system permease component RcnA
MQRRLLISGLAVAALLAILWATGVFAQLTAWALGEQRAVQNALARGIRGVRAGDAGALVALLAVCFAYGFLHAVGPGHGKVLIGGYGVARRIRMVPLMVIAFAASMAQAAVAIGIVAALFALLGWTREAVLGVSEDMMAPVGHVLVGMVGLWLVARGARRIWHSRAIAAHHPARHDHHDHDHHHHHDAHCNHAHGPTLEQVTALTGWRDTAALIAGIAIRPCSGALFLLILTFQMGIAAAGIAGTFAMGLGTASVTVAVAVLAVWSREGLFATLGETRLARALPVVEMAAGAVVVVIAWQMLRAGV